MIVREVPFQEQLLAAIEARRGQGRAPGMHVTHVISRIEQAAGKTYSPGDFRLTAENGFIWEEALECAFRNYMRQQRDWVVKQEPQMLDGIWMTPDGFDAKTGTLEEYKSTFKSAAKLDALEEHFWSWMVQIKAYCRAFGTLKARLYVMFWRGDYRGPQPIVRCLELEFTQWEVDENWMMLRRAAEEMRSEVAA